MARDVVLLLTHTGDWFVPDRVAEELRARGATPVRVDTDRYPAELDLALGLDAPRVAGVDPDRIRAVWTRRLWSSRLPEGLEPVAARAIRQEARAHWFAVLDALGDRRQVNPLAAERRVEGHKLHQLRRARAAGLSVPDTLITNQPEAARAFCEAHGYDVVAKLLSPVSRSMSGAGPRVPTRRLSRDDLDHLDELRLGPMCLQPRIPARHELRVAWVEGRCFVGETGGGDTVDWRQGDAGGWRPGALDDRTCAALDRLMTDLGLSYGGVDLIVPPEGPPVFLEVNPAGEWGMLEHALGLPVAAALADALLKD
ncbi:MAG: MvdC family ATP-grasp ribosomal peptide maturase [Alphaproteobacteria bacterium]|nr:MvdC family ATP-grasp ribosomal peptide maturase [Alphaproteobacteria bacterium]